jgi:hypothetical protein
VFVIAPVAGSMTVIERPGGLPAPIADRLLATYSLSPRGVRAYATPAGNTPAGIVADSVSCPPATSSTYTTPWPPPATHALRPSGDHATP